MDWTVAGLTKKGQTRSIFRGSMVNFKNYEATVDIIRKYGTRISALFVNNKKY